MNVKGTVARPKEVDGGRAWLSSDSGRQSLIEALKTDIEGEHRAIVQYLYHAWQTPDGIMRAKLEGLARDEMHHLEWLSRAVVGLGGEPDFKRGPVMREGNIRDLLAKDLEDEKGAISAYRERIRQAEAAGESDLALRLERILADEKGHRDFLTAAINSLPSEFRDQGEEGAGEQHKGAPPEEDMQYLKWAIDHEYEVVMEYVLYALTGQDPEALHDLLDIAVDEMKHLGALAETVTDLGGKPDLENVSPPRRTALEEGLLKAISTEKTVTEMYDRGARRASSDEIKALFDRIRLDEVHHDVVFRRILEKMKKKGEEGAVGSSSASRRGLRPAFTLGSLKREGESG